MVNTSETKNEKLQNNEATVQVMKQPKTFAQQVEIIKEKGFIIDNDTEYQTLSKKICSITKHFSQEELIYYTICLYRQEPEYRAYKEIGCSYCGLLPIKKSCIMKFACALDIEVYNDNEGFIDPNEEEKFKRFIKEFKL